MKKEASKETKCLSSFVAQQLLALNLLLTPIYLLLFWLLLCEALLHVRAKERLFDELPVITPYLFTQTNLAEIFLSGLGGGAASHHHFPHQSVR